MKYSLVITVSALFLHTMGHSFRDNIDEYSDGMDDVAFNEDQQVVENVYDSPSPNEVVRVVLPAKRPVIILKPRSLVSKAVASKMVLPGNAVPRVVM
ncbi:hypothetical protein AYI69_g6364 [Smittium culicis]|uniref:Uncharacterized protein n=1 Tax=Smittium culicis TaxID=133412 RepID=A0A1R1XZE4_9FUNG|nr:hypothetical protein AYI69_g6364 [Smittium culicis]